MSSAALQGHGQEALGSLPGIALPHQAVGPALASAAPAALDTLHPAQPDATMMPADRERPPKNIVSRRRAKSGVPPGGLRVSGTPKARTQMSDAALRVVAKTLRKKRRKEENADAGVPTIPSSPPFQMFALPQVAASIAAAPAQAAPSTPAKDASPPLQVGPSSTTAPVSFGPLVEVVTVSPTSVADSVTTSGHNLDSVTTGAQAESEVDYAREPSDTPRPQECRDASVCTPVTPPSPASAADAPDEWLYFDAVGDEHGPFPLARMRKWYLNDNFPLREKMLVRRSTWSYHLPASFLWPLANDIFWTLPACRTTRTTAETGHESLVHLPWRPYEARMPLLPRIPAAQRSTMPSALLRMLLATRETLTCRNPPSPGSSRGDLPPRRAMPSRRRVYDPTMNAPP